MLEPSNNPLVQPGEIMKRIEKLNQLRDQQTEFLLETKYHQMKSLKNERAEWYKKMGFDPPPYITQDSDADENVTRPDIVDDGSSSVLNDSASSDSGTNKPDYIYEGNNNVLRNERSFFDENEYDAEALERSLQLPKRTFLKRGEGLKKRFHIDPEQLRLNNLPHYKYANYHSKFLFDDKKREKTMPAKKPAARSMQLKKTTKTTKMPTLDPQEKRFQQLLISSKKPKNSTPDFKTNSAKTISPRKKTNVKRSSPNQQHQPQQQYGAKTTTTTLRHIKQNGDDAALVKSSRQPLPWSKVLDSQQIKPIIVGEMRDPQAKRHSIDDDQNLSIFELLEQKANDGTIDMNSSSMIRFMERKMRVHDQRDDHSITVRDDLRLAGIRPSVREVINDDENSSETSVDMGNNNSREKGNYSLTKKPGRVRFSEELSTCEYTDDDAANHSGSTLKHASNVEQLPEVHLFEEFKTALFAALQSRADQAASNQNDTTDMESQGNETEMSPQSSPRTLSAAYEMEKRTEMLKVRIGDLEHEIAIFKRNNLDLLHAKQQHELERTQFVQQQQDEKIQMEMYFHDERMKLDAERQKNEHDLRMKRSNGKERKEIAQLRQELLDCQAQQKQREHEHAAAQARLRVQIRNLEREQRQLYGEIEELNKENKRLANENGSIVRSQNNKMLQEINRNIAKLAPKLQPSEESVAAGRRPAATTSSTISNLKVTTSSSTQKPVKSPIERANPVRRLVGGNDKMSTEPSTSSSAASCYLPRNAEFDDDDEDDDDDEIAGALQTKQTARKPSTESTTPKTDEEPPKGEEQKAAAQEEEATGDDKNNTANKTDLTPSRESSRGTNTNTFKREIINDDGSKDIWYPNGNLKKISADGMNVRILYFNKDIKESNANKGTVKYYYAQTNTWQTSYVDGLEIYEFPSGQKEHRHKNGCVETYFPNGSVKISDPNDQLKMEEWNFANGSNLVQLRSGNKILTFPNGQKEIHTSVCSRREYPDGTVKMVYPDGSTETRYSNGRVRLKDKTGKLLVDTDA